MTPEQLINQFKTEALAKFEQGRIEHDGNLEEKGAYWFIKPEIIDLFWYYTYGEKQIKLAIEKLNTILSGTIPPMELHDRIREVRNILQYGNEAGVEYSD